MLRPGQPQVERAVRPLPVVVVDVNTQHAFEVVEDQQPVKALGAHGSDEALGDRVRFGRANRRPDDLDAFAAEAAVEVTREFAVAIADRKRTGVARSGKLQASWRACWVTHALSGLGVQPARWTLRLPSWM